MKIFIAGLFLLLYSNPVLSQENEAFDTLIKSVDSEEILLEPGMGYHSFDASNEYLTFYEAYTSTIYFYNIENQKISRLELVKGKGPHEIRKLMGLVISGERAVLYDIINSKIVLYDIEEKKYLKEFVIKEQIYSIATDGDKIYGKIARPDALFCIVDIENEKVEHINESKNLSVAKEYVRNMYRFDGAFVASENYLISMRYYEPNYFGYSFDSKSFHADNYDILNKEIRYEKNRLGFASGLPDKLELRLLSADVYNKDQLALIIEGKGVNNAYGKSHIHIYDLVQKKFTDKISTNMGSTKYIAINDNKIFIYDNENYAIKILSK